MPSKLTENDKLIWEQAVKDIQPLQKNKVPSAPPEKKTPQKRIIFTSDPSGFSAPSLTKNDPLPTTFKKKERKNIRIESFLDLHGKTREEGEVAFLRFIVTCQKKGYRWVLVITGKGEILRKAAPEWFNKYRSTIVGYSYANPTHGGEGAFYLRIRRGLVNFREDFSLKF